ncbi:NADH-quinone oxidoreductase subunit N [Candidatus Woesearchaeota archaeon]|nr:NADH-quinone oxidoreductase subunit N [Candidatus Woesearchaeota archaeon]
MFALLPELAVLALALAVLLGDLLRKGRARELAWLSVAGLAGAFLLTLRTTYGTLFTETLVADAFGVVLKQLFLAGTAVVILLSMREMERFAWKAEYLSLVLFVCAGMMLMVSANELITLYVALEIVTITLFILTAYRKRDALSVEAGLKLYVQGFASSGILLYGLSLLYGATNTTYLPAIAQALARGSPTATLLLGAVMVLAGFGFKLSIVPFHMWVPDVYQGAPTPITAFLSVGSKAAGFAVAMRVLVLALGSLQGHLIVVLGALAVVTMFLGNLLAISQNNVKRLLAYSTIAHVGYMLLALVMSPKVGAASLLFYLAVYTFANLLAFAVLIALSDAGGGEDISAFSGLVTRSPWLAVAMVAALLSLGGIPPVAGFVGKFYLFANAVREGFLLLALAGVVNTIISMYYYLRIVREMFIVKSAAPAVLPSFALKVAVALCLAAIVFFGLYPAPLLRSVEYAAALLVR